MSLSAGFKKNANSLMDDLLVLNKKGKIFGK